MSRGRCQQILRFLQFDNAQSRRHHRSPDKQQPIKKMFETWDSYLRDSYTCRRNMTVHEQLVCFRERCSFKQYIPSKPSKRGIKLWTICDSTCSYTRKILVYIRKDAGLARKTKRGTRIVLDLAEDIDNFCRNITCDNFFTNQSIACTKPSSKKSHTDRNNEEEQAGVLNGIYRGQRTECEEHSLRLSTRCNNYIVLF